MAADKCRADAVLTKTASGTRLVRWATTVVCTLVAVGPVHAQAAKKAPLNAKGLYRLMLKSTAYVGIDGSGVGTASLVDKKRKLLLTNQHVVQTASEGKLFVIFPIWEKGSLVVDKKVYDKELESHESVIPGYVEYQDKKADLALIRLAGLPDGVVPLSPADNSAVAGQMMYAMGNPPPGAWVMSSGRARSFPHHRKWTSDDRLREKAIEREAIVIECSSPLNAGDSGGPVVNDWGELIGVTIEWDARLPRRFIDIWEVGKFLARYYKKKDIELPEAWSARERSDALVERGNAHLKKKEYEKAIDDFSVAIRLTPKDAEAFCGRGNAHLARREYEKAIDNFSESIRLTPTFAEAFTGRGNAYAARQDYDKAIRDYNWAELFDRNNALVLYNRGNSHAAKESYDEAIGDYTKAIRLKPDFADAFYNRGDAHLHKEEYDKAIHDFSEVIRLNRKDAEAFCERGRGYGGTKEYEKAIDDFTEAIRLDPINALAFNNLSWLLATCPNDGLRNGKRAVELATTACKLSKFKVAEYLETLAAAHAESGDFKEAVKWQAKGLGLGVSDNDRAQKCLKLYQSGKAYRGE